MVIGERKVSSCKLIIVEDERIIRESLLSFEWESIQVEVAASFDNGLDALDFLRDNAVDIALTDMRMPIMDGVEFIKCVRKEFPEVAIVCLSGYSDYEYLRECMLLGVKDYLLKPTNKEQLFQTISRLVDEKVQDDAKTQNYIITKALEYIEQNYHRPIKLADVADHICLNTVYFSRVFKQHMGVRFVEYLTDYRIEQAISLMKNPTVKINVIADKVGFFSSRYFADTFKKRKGMTPSEYRNKYWNTSE